MDLKIVGFDEKRFHIDEGGNKHIYFQLSTMPDDDWKRFFDRFYAMDPNSYKGYASVIENNYIQVVTYYHDANAVKNCVESAVGNANSEYRKMLNERRIRQEQQKHNLKEQAEKRDREYKDFKNQLDNLKFDD